VKSGLSTAVFNYIIVQYEKYKIEKILFVWVRTIGSNSPQSVLNAGSTTYMLMKHAQFIVDKTEIQSSIQHSSWSSHVSVNAFIGSRAGMLAMEGWMEVSGPPQAEDPVVVPTEHKGVQTEPEEPIHQTPSCGLLEEEPTGVASVDLELPTEDRSLEECVKIYKSPVKMCLVSRSEASLNYGRQIKELRM
jgi:hypothetical protein